MKFPYSMLLEFVETQLSAHEAGDLLTMAGFELEGAETIEGESVLDVKVMSNRGDGLSMLGLAREVLAKDLSAKPTPLYLRAKTYFQDSPSGGSGSNPVRITISTRECRRYACRAFLNLQTSESPQWLQRRLRQAGMRPISHVVDLTNYVMLELGQPLHAFDLDLLQGAQIVVRKAVDGEELTTLDGKSHHLNSTQMMICDAVGPVGAAGIMGGAATEFSDTTRNLLIESAHFESTSVRRTRRQLGLSTEASYRYERSVDPEGAVAAIQRFTELLGQPCTQIQDEYPNRQPRSPVSVRVDRARMLLGMDLKASVAQTCLERLGMEVGGHGDPFFVVPPTWRPDIQREEDLIEELGRVHGYEKIPELLPTGTPSSGHLSVELATVDGLRQSVIRHGYSQIVSHSLSSEHALDADTPRIGPRVVASPEYALLRNGLWPGLVEALKRNGGKNLHLFEIGKVFHMGDSEPIERRKFAILSTGELLPSFRKGESVPQATFYSLKGDVLHCLADVGFLAELAPTDSPDLRLHPGRQALVVVGDHTVGLIGQIHPTLAQDLKLEPETFLAEIDIDVFSQIPEVGLNLKPISRNPAVKRDIALLISLSTPYREIERLIRDSAGEVLENVSLFDDFAGEGIPSGMHSLGITLQLRKLGDTFTDEEANQVRDQVVAALVTLGGSAR